jgi:hypothetical protein
MEEANEGFRVQCTEQLDQRRDYACPSGLVASPIPVPSERPYSVVTAFWRIGGGIHIFLSCETQRRLNQRLVLPSSHVALRR